MQQLLNIIHVVPVIKSPVKTPKESKEIYEYLQRADLWRLGSSVEHIQLTRKSAEV